MSSIPVPLSDYARPAILSNTNTAVPNSSNNAYYFVGGIILFLVVNGIWWYAYTEQNRTMRGIRLDNGKLQADLEKAKEAPRRTENKPNEASVNSDEQV